MFSLKKTNPEHRQVIITLIIAISIYSGSLAAQILPHNNPPVQSKQKNKPAQYNNSAPRHKNNNKKHKLNPNYRVNRALLNVGYDYKNYYSGHNLALLSYGILGSALFANTRLDEQINRTYQNHFVNHSTDQFARIVKHPGNNSTILVYLGGSLLGMAVDRWPAGNTFSNWSSRTLRSLIVGAPPVIVLQRVLGTGRPGSGSSWHPFQHANAVSGHAFLGSLPFITAAQMTNHMPLKIIFYLGSTLTGWSRLNDNDHYFSQVILGWWMGYLAASSVSQTQDQHRWHITPYGWSDGTIGVQATLTL